MTEIVELTNNTRNLFNISPVASAYTFFKDRSIF